MQIKSIIKKSSLLACLLVGVLTGSIAFAAVNDGDSTQDKKEKIVFPKNAAGQRYGSAANVSSFKDWPELVAATGVDGNEGYIRKADLDEDMPKSPKEALEKQAKRESRLINLYDKDGKKVIGKFEIKPPIDKNNKNAPSEQKQD